MSKATVYNIGRTPIQIALAESGKIVALCDDGTMWLSYTNWRTKELEWGQINGIPQTVIKKEVKISDD